MMPRWLRRLLRRRYNRMVRMPRAWNAPRPVRWYAIAHTRRS